MKVCYKCGEKKPLSEFSKNKAKYDGLSSQCKACHKKLRRLHYENNRETIIRQVQDWKEDYRKWFRSLKKNKPCSDCGMMYPHYVMDWDHLDDKEFDISWAVSHNWSRARVLREIKKCELVCANCHRERTYGRRTIGV